MKRRTLKSLIFALLLVTLLIPPTTALADGIIIPDPPPGIGPIPITQLVIRYHHVEVTIEDQVAVTRVDQVFYNPNDWDVEGTYIFPLPDGATVTEFTLWVDGQPVEGEVLAAGQARDIYEQIVRDLQDPALLEYLDRGAVKASIFPIPAGGERRVELEYSQVLTAENGLVRYVYPLNTEKFSLQPLEEVSVSVELRSSQPIRAVYSPSHAIAVDRLSSTYFDVGYEEYDVTPDSDFALYYSVGESEAFHLLTYRDPSDPQDSDGFFMLLLAPRPDLNPEALPKDLILVLDKSGSMDGEKFRQAQAALSYILEHLNPEDRFNLISFSTGIESYAAELQPASRAADAVRWAENLSAAGSTDINRALLEAASLGGGERPTYLIFLTDGLPTEGVTDSQMILDNLAQAAPDNLRLFAFGVGYDVDTFLLDSLALAHHGTATYVLPGERLDETLSAFYAKVSTPVLTDLELDFGDLAVYDVYPDPLPDLFSGSQIVVTGRYREGGEASITLRGEAGGTTYSFTLQDQSFALDSRGERGPLETLPRLWATRKIGYLLNQVRLNGADEETIDQIVRLSIRYGIVTPYTSYLVTEPLLLGNDAQSRIVEEQFAEMQAMPTPLANGQDAVEKAAGQGAMAEAEAPMGGGGEVEGVQVAEVVKAVGARTFVLSEGVWIDTAFDPDSMETVKVAFLSEDYFALAAARPELGAAFALGERVIALADGVAYEVVPADQPADEVDIPAAYQVPDDDSAVQAQADPSDSSDGDALSLPPCLGAALPLLFLPLVVLFKRRLS